MLDKDAIPSYEIGYWVNTDLAGNGYATEVVHELVKYAFDELGAKRLSILTDSRNTASERVAEKCGFEYEGIAKNGAAHWDESGAVDVKVFSLIPTGLVN
jgi:RimJ/RimL family protein N-acetyltransferase